ncbi:MAG: hypothetical protein KF767_12390 [Bdellovibrionaceae bacterium]|nr:hypothetical protein [Pseudobdellovibrionaceae bacterium]
MTTNDKASSEQLKVLRWIYESPWLTFDAGLDDEKISAACEFRNFEAIYGAHGAAETAAGGQALVDLTADYLAKCEKEIATGPKDLARNLYRTLFIRFAVENNPYFRRVIFNLPNGYRQPGLIALKDDKHRRPWLILRAGILGNSVDIQAERFILLQLFEQGPFNVIFLDSMTSAETIKLNEKLSVGGLDEGLQNYQIARRLKDPAEPLSRLVGDIHLMALSMGGHGLFMAMILNELNPPVFKSAVGLCPMVQFQETFSGHERSPLSFLGMNLYASFRMSPLMKRIPNIRRSWFLPDAFAYVRDGYQGPLTDDGSVKFPEGLPKADFLRGNVLLPYIKTIRHPVSVFATKKDDLVPFAINTGMLMELPEKNPDVRIYPLEESFHCSFPGAYSWAQMGELLKAQFFGARSLESGVPGFRRQTWPVPQLESGQVVNAKVKFELRDQDQFLTAKITTAEGTEVATQIPIDALAWGTIGRVRNETEARTLARWAQQNIHLSATEDGHLALAWPVPER